jgi:hypothetical protein
MKTGDLVLLKRPKQGAWQVGKKLGCESGSLAQRPVASVWLVRRAMMACVAPACRLAIRFCVSCCEEDAYDVRLSKVSVEFLM